MILFLTAPLCLSALSRRIGFQEKQNFFFENKLIIVVVLGGVKNVKKSEISFFNAVYGRFFLFKQLLKKCCRC